MLLDYSFYDKQAKAAASLDRGAVGFTPIEESKHFSTFIWSYSPAFILYP